VHKVSIVPRGVGALGYTMQRPTEDRFLLTIDDLKHRIAVLMGGRAAERLIFDGEISTGAADDLQRATEIAIEMVTKFGMDPGVGDRIYAPLPQPFLQPRPQDQVVSASADTSREIDIAVRKLVEEGAERAATILQQRRADLDEGARLLLEKETLTVADFPPLGPAAERDAQGATGTAGTPGADHLTEA
jgi:cell division protease FtsH